MAKIRVALINPPYIGRFSRSQRSPGVIKSGTMYYPYWLASSAAVLEKQGFEIGFFDCPAANISFESLINQLKEFKPDLCVLETTTASSESDCQSARTIKEQLNGKVCMVGTHVTALWEETLRDYPAIDYVAIGEYDYIIRDLATALSSFTEAEISTAKIPGLALRSKSGEILCGPTRPPIENVDELPWIATIYKKFLDPNNYYFSLASYPMVMLIGGRGCVAKCTYCVYPQVMHGHRYRTRSPKSIVGEMKWIQENMPEVKEIVFEDDTFTGDQDFAREVARLVREEGVRLPWFANVRTSVGKETLKHLKEAGFRCCAAGFESGDEILLKNMWKGTTLENQKRFVKDCKELGILVHGCFMVGFPGETKATMDKTLKLALHLSPDSAQFYPVMPYPGTSYYEWAKTNGYIAASRFSDWLTEEGGHKCVLNLPGLPPKEIEQFCERAFVRFHLRPKYIAYKLRQSFLSPREGIRSIKSFFFFLIYLFTNKRKHSSTFLAPEVEVPKGWYAVHQMPKGRMFKQEIELRSKNVSKDINESEAAT